MCVCRIVQSTNINQPICFSFRFASYNSSVRLILLIHLITLLHLSFDPIPSEVSSIFVGFHSMRMVDEAKSAKIYNHIEKYLKAQWKLRDSRVAMLVLYLSCGHIPLICFFSSLRFILFACFSHWYLLVLIVKLTVYLLNSLVKGRYRLNFPSIYFFIPTWNISIYSSLYTCFRAAHNHAELSI